MADADANHANPPADKPVRTGIIAGPEEARPYLDALARIPGFHIAAQSGVPQAQVSEGVNWFDDKRVLIAQGEIDAVLIDGSPRLCVELGRHAAENGVHVWQRPPLARSFGEATEVLHQARDRGVVRRVMSWWDHVGAEVRAMLTAQRDFQPSFSEVSVTAAGPVLQAWQSDGVSAGGGVLMLDSYPMLEALIAVRGLPESVIGMVTQCRRTTGQAPRETEDVATALLRYANGGVAQVRACWDIHPLETQTSHHGRTATVRYDQKCVQRRGADGATGEERDLPGEWLDAELRRFLARIRTGPVGDEDATLTRHLAVSALLESFYLSVRTGQPEIPRRRYEVQRWPLPAR